MEEDKKMRKYVKICCTHLAEPVRPWWEMCAAVFKFFRVSAFYLQHLSPCNLSPCTFSTALLPSCRISSCAIHKQIPLGFVCLQSRNVLICLLVTAQKVHFVVGPDQLI